MVEGPPARGGGKTHQFYASQGKTIANNKIELTIQGQTITSVFGNKDQAKYNFEQLLTAGIENEVFKIIKKILPKKKERLLKNWQVTVTENILSKTASLFVPYLQEISTFSITVKPILEVALASVVQVTN
jgi:phosphoenolpyruvate carboxylase